MSHSISPEIFGFLSRELEMPLSYVRLPLTEEQLGPTTRATGKLGLFRGWNVTIPHKESVLELADVLSPEVRAIRAANVLRFDEGRIEAHNTDAYGVEGTLREHEIPVRGQQCLLLGAGGAGRAAAYALGSMGAREVVVRNRDFARARKLCADFGRIHRKTRYRAMAFGGRASEFGLIINSTPLGMKGFPAKSLLPEGASKGAWAFDLVYRPEDTPFLREARKRGLKTVGGLDMLVWQALASWKIWFGSVPREQALKKALVKHLRAYLKETTE